MNFIVKFVLAAICLSCSASAQALEPTTSSPNFARISRLTLSTNGTYVHAPFHGRLIVASLEDALDLAPQRHALSLELFNDMGAVQFTDSDRYLFTQRSDGSFQRYDLEHLADGEPALDDSLRVAGEGLATENFTMYFPEGARNLKTWSPSAQRVVNSSAPLLSGDIGFNSRNVYGFIYGSRYIFLSRDRDFAIHVHTRTIADKIFDRHGHAYYTRYSNLDFKYDAGRYYILVSGSILSSDERGRLRIASATETSAQFISGDLPGRYYGYFTPSAVHPHAIDAGLAKEINAFLRREPHLFISGVSINNRAKSFVISYIAGIQGEFNYHDAYSSKDVVYAHFIYAKGRKTTLTPDGDATPVQYYQVKLADGRAVDNYTVKPGGKSLIYVHGGPNDSETLADSSVVQYFLSTGVNVDVVNYGGAAYSYGLVNAIHREGLASYARNAEAISDYIASNYPNSKRAYLYLASFSGQFYRFIPEDTLRRLGGVVLAEPAGSTDPLENTQTLPIKAMRRSIYGDVVISGAFDNRYYESLVACQIRSKTLLVYGSKDTRVNPAYDYRFCSDSPLLTTYIFPGEHGQSYKYAFDKIVNFIDRGDPGDK